MSDNLPWKTAILKVLTEQGEAMHYTDIAEVIVDQELREALGATPANSVNSIISLSIREDYDSPFYKAGRGLFGLKIHQSMAPSVDVPMGDAIEEADGESDNMIIQALGMFWLRQNVYWKSAPSILGRQQVGADTVDFTDQRGVYLLHDRRDVVYVGRSVDRGLGQRLFEHTQDRLNGRWDRFSWFGLCGVDDHGHLTRPLLSCDSNLIIHAFEAILIESLEPPQNRRRGDSLNAAEFMQARDPEIDRRQTRDLLQQVMAKLD
ncbi:HTH domain-containing protein [Pirellulimonas nuda]|uniref:HTH domain-containing protein n=1 Tax=Pirellulimonas nuda TaxID=2528009 RepID=UPI0011A4D438|nr:HTH domain-containing protein [Pirellulimonas nuda]